MTLDHRCLRVGEIMSSRNLKTCFISAPVGIDTRPLREALSARGVEPWDASDMLAGSNSYLTVEDAIADADFICAVIPNSPVNANVLLELGMAIGMGLPRLLFVAPKAELPSDLRRQSYARASLQDAEALRFHLGTFLKNAGKSGGYRGVGHREGRSRPSPAIMASAHDRLAAWQAQLTPPHERELVQFLAELFEVSGYITSAAPTSIGRNSMHADLAVWVDELQTTIGNPLVIEVAGHQRTPSAKFRQLQLLLEEFQSPLGLLVYWRIPEAQLMHDDWDQPLVVVMDIHEVVESIGRGDFASILLSRRNAAAHSAA